MGPRGKVVGEPVRREAGFWIPDSPIFPLGDRPRGNDGREKPPPFVTTNRFGRTTNIYCRLARTSTGTSLTYIAYQFSTIRVRRYSIPFLLIRD